MSWTVATLAELGQVPTGQPPRTRSTSASSSTWYVLLLLHIVNSSGSAHPHPPAHLPHLRALGRPTAVQVHLPPRPPTRRGRPHPSIRRRREHRGARLRAHHHEPLARCRYQGLIGSRRNGVFGRNVSNSKPFTMSGHNVLEPTLVNSSASCLRLPFHLLD